MGTIERVKSGWLGQVIWRIDYFGTAVYIPAVITSDPDTALAIVGLAIRMGYRVRIVPIEAGE